MQFACKNIVLHDDHHKNESFRVTVIFVDQMSLCGTSYEISGHAVDYQQFIKV